jgi:hypothetical protein
MRVRFDRLPVGSVFRYVGVKFKKVAHDRASAESFAYVADHAQTFRRCLKVDVVSAPCKLK